MQSNMDRRTFRSKNQTEALAHQLERCTRDGHLAGMILSDADGLCLASAGDDNVCTEVAARLPLMGQRVGKFAGVLYSAKSMWPITMRKFVIANTPLFACAIGGEPDTRPEQVERSIDAATRILAKAV